MTSEYNRIGVEIKSNLFLPGIRDPAFGTLFQQDRICGHGLGPAAAKQQQQKNEIYH
jgi:hypothetical protein